MKKLMLKENEQYNTVPAIITLSALFPTEIMRTCIALSDNEINDIRNFLEYLLPEQYRMIRHQKDLIEYDSTSIKCFWNGNIENFNKYDLFFTAVKDNLIFTAPKIASEFHCIVNKLFHPLQIITKKMPADSLQDYENDIYELCKTIEKNRSKFSGFSTVDLCKSFPVLNKGAKHDKNSFLITLAHLSMMACTSSIWCKPEKNTQTAAETTAHLLFPCLSTNIIQITYHDGLAEVPRICWATLFPDSFLSKYQESSKKKISPTHVAWFRDFIPDEYQTKNGRHFVSDRSVSSFSNFWGGKPEGNSCCKLIADNIIQAGKKLSTKYDALLHHIIKKCHDILSILPNDYINHYQQDINCLFTLLRDNSGLISGFENKDFNVITTTSQDTDIEQIDLLSRELSFLIIVAATWTIWISPKNAKLAKDLATILFPQKSNTTDTDLRSDTIKKENKEAADKLNKAKKAFYDGEFSICGNLCRKIITINLADDQILGDAYYYLVRCHDDHNYHYEGYYNSEEFKYRALDFGSEEALKKWPSRHLNSLLYIPDTGKTEISDVVSNTPLKDYLVDIFLRSRPEDNTPSGCNTNYVQNTSDFSTYIRPYRKIRFLLFHNNFEKNYIDLLYILDFIKNWNTNNEKKKVSNNDVWKDFKVYVRLNETQYASLLDTALKHMEGIHVPVYLIDDNKWAAQNLLSHYPLFYPIRPLSPDILSKSDITINLNIISESSNDLTNWLMREAYWLGCFYYTGITLAINIISPEAKKIISRLEYDCPGIFLPIPDSDKVSKIRWDFDTCVPNSLESEDLFKGLDKLRNIPNSYSYYIINCNSDISSLNLAIKIREWEIRKTIHSSASIKSATVPVITYHCENLDVAHMAESMVVHQESYGDNWYNNYSIIPFNFSQHYLWDEIDGGYLEKVSQSVHLQYYECEINASKEEKDEKLNDYFTRSYNRDSSFAVALSMPYRLFQMSSSRSDHIIPVGWVLKNKEAYSDSISLNRMATQAKDYTNKREMLNYERARWMRYMISRGWQKASSDETIKFMKAGNPKRQLYIGLLHGCICSQEELIDLQKQLYNEYEFGLIGKYDKRFAGNDPRLIKTKDGKTDKVFDKYFQFDIRSLDQTADIIRTSWFSEKEIPINLPSEVER